MLVTMAKGKKKLMIKMSCEGSTCLNKFNGGYIKKHFRMEITHKKFFKSVKYTMAVFLVFPSLFLLQIALHK